MSRLAVRREGVSQSLSATQTRETTAQQRRATALRIGSLATAGHHAAGAIPEIKGKRLILNLVVYPSSEFGKQFAAR
jgi:hypothetical protein